jgi:predicted RNA binding protein YcfA (HicA-like mRNA interferase family)
MARSKGGWRARDLDRLYRGFGFDHRQGGPHVVYFHPRFPTLTATVTRSSGTLPKGYIETAMELLDLLDTFAKQARRETDDRSTN